MSAPLHEPVMVAETVTLLAPSRGGLFVDCTVGLGGHTRALLEAGASRILGLDRDPEALRIAAECARRVRRPRRAGARGLSRPGARARRAWRSRHRRRAGGSRVCPRCSSKAEGRGFSFRRDDPLDMRMDRSQGPTAADLIADDGRGVARERDLPVRRRTLLATDRAGHRRRAAARARSGPPRRWRRSSDGAIPRRGYQRIDPGDAHVPGAADLGQPRARRARALPAGGRAVGCSAARGWPSSRSTRSRIGSSSTRSARSSAPRRRCAS